MEKMSSAKEKQAASKAFMIYILVELDCRNTCRDNILMHYTLMTNLCQLVGFTIKPCS